MSLISYTKKKGFRTAQIFRITPREAPPKLYIEKIAKRKITRKGFAARALKDVERQAARAVKTEARARIAIKHYRVKEEQKTYAYITSHRARLQRRRVRRAQLEASERISLAKRTLHKRASEFQRLVKRAVYKKGEFKKHFEKTAKGIRKDVAERERLSQEYQEFLANIKRKKHGIGEGWYLIYEIELCEKSPPCDPNAEGTYWELRTEFYSKQAKKYGITSLAVGREMEQIYARNGFLWRTRRERIIYVKGGAK